MDRNLNIYVTGDTRDPKFPLKHPIQNVLSRGESLGSDAFVAKINPNASKLLFSSYIGGNFGELGVGITVDLEGNIYLAGKTDSTDFPLKKPIQNHLAGTVLSGDQDCFVVKIRK